MLSQSGASHIVKCVKCVSMTRFYPNPLDAINRWNSRVSDKDEKKCDHAWALTTDDMNRTNYTCVKCHQSALKS